jgi:hypothetical protein
MTNAINKSLGFNKNPFSKFSAEEELDFHNEIFFKPTFYDTLLEDLKSGTSRFILGQRGHGKSSIIHKLKTDLENRKVFTVIIDRFDNISIDNNKIELLNLILHEYVSKLGIYLYKNPKLVSRLEAEDKEFLALLFKLFFKPLTSNEYEKIYNSVNKVKTKNKLIKFWNKITSPTNAVINTGVLITSTILTEHLGISKIEGYKYQEFFKKIEAENFRDSKTEEILLVSDKRTLKEILDRSNSTIKKLGFLSSVILFDKVDEFQDLNQDINKISAFTEGILTDTELLLQNDIAIAFSLWSEIKPILAKKVRFDKFKEIDISWKKKDMKPLIDKRILYFSNQNKKLDDLIENQNDIDDVVSISNHSPRDLISCLSDIYDFQSAVGASPTFESSIVSKGLIKFATRYDYHSIYPSRTGKNKDVITMINRILRSRKVFFSIGDMNDTFNQKTRWSEKNCIEPMLRYKLIKEDDKLGSNGERIYEIIDPKIKFLISRNITSLDN